VNYYISRRIDSTFEDAVASLKKELEQAGFSIWYEFDVQDYFRQKISEDFPPYWIIGACNPQFALEALNTDPRIGAMMPCSVAVKGVGDGVVEITASDLKSMVLPVGSSMLIAIADEVQLRLRKVITSL
jgi:uncharacterized protein (DUF302 family)